MCSEIHASSYPNRSASTISAMSSSYLAPIWSFGVTIPWIAPRTWLEKIPKRIRSPQPAAGVSSNSKVVWQRTIAGVGLGSPAAARAAASASSCRIRPLLVDVVLLGRLPHRDVEVLTGVVVVAQQ